jgi:hypothetical protein
VKTGAAEDNMELGLYTDKVKSMKKAKRTLDRELWGVICEDKKNVSCLMLSIFVSVE